MPPKSVIRQIPPAHYFGPLVEAAEAQRTTALDTRDNAQEKVGALLAGGSRFNPLVIGSQDRPSDVEKAAIAADDALLDSALANGEDVSKVGTPNRSAYRRELETAEAVLRAAERALADAEERLIEALKAERHLALANLRPAYAEAHKAHMADLDNVDASKRRLLAVEGALRFLPLLEEEYPDRLDYRVAGTGGVRPVVGQNFVTVSFDQMIATMRHEAQPPALLDVDEHDTEIADAQADTNHKTSPAVPARASLDNRFSSDLPRRARERLRRDGEIR